MQDPTTKKDEAEESGMEMAAPHIPETGNERDANDIEDNDPDILFHDQDGGEG
ncbi:MAG: hypothetical protein ABI741_06210 [Ferruginibacter sp.]